MNTLIFIKSVPISGLDLERARIHKDPSTLTDPSPVRILKKSKDPDPSTPLVTDS